MATSFEKRRRAEGRREWPITRHRLQAERSDDLSATTTPEERLSMMWELAVQAWLLSGRPIPEYSRENMPGKVIRPRR